MTNISHDPGKILEKAHKACTSARLVLNAGDLDGATNRAYYAMFNAARAAVLVTDAATKKDFHKTHSGLISEFNRVIIRTGILPDSIGKMLGRAQNARLMADYMDESVSARDAESVVENAAFFIDEICTACFSENHTEDNDQKSRPKI